MTNLRHPQHHSLTETTVSSSTTCTTSLPTNHLAVVIMATQPDRATLITIRECARRFPSHQVHVVGYGIATTSHHPHRSMAKALQKYGLLRRVNYTFRQTGANPRHALLEVCRVKLFLYSHILLVDTAVAGRNAERLQDTLYGGTCEHLDDESDNDHDKLYHGDDEPTFSLCGYFGRPAASQATATAAESKPGLLSRFAARRRRRGVATLNAEPVVIGKKKKRRNNNIDKQRQQQQQQQQATQQCRCMDVWERAALLSYLDGKVAALTCSTGCLTQALQQSTHAHVPSSLAASTQKVLMYE